MKKLIIGIDPGKSGGIAILDFDGEVKDVIKMPEGVEFIKIFRKCNGEIFRVFLERQSAFPKQGVVSMFRLGEHFGFLKGVLMSLNISCEEVSSQRWKRFWGLLLKGDRKRRKELAVEKARKLFPYVEEKFQVNLRKVDGIAEALLIAEFGRLRLLKGEK
jgi:hypothetical protein